MQNGSIESEKFAYQLNNIDTTVKNFKIKSSSSGSSIVKTKKKTKVRYPSQLMMVGQIRCFFYKHYKYGRKPLFSIGPSWHFTIGLLIFAFMALFYFTFMLSLLKVIDY
jgi:hypothetical protein